MNRCYTQAFHFYFLDYFWWKAVLLESGIDRDLKSFNHFESVVILKTHLHLRSLSWTHPSKIKGISIYELKTGAVVQDRSQVVK